MVMGQMVRYDPDQNSVTALMGDLAESWEILEGGTKYVFHLRDDAYWHDGTQVTSADVLAHWDWFTSKTGSSAGNWRIVLDRHEAPDDFTAIIYLTDVFPDLIPEMAWQSRQAGYIFQKAQLEAAGVSGGEGDADEILIPELIGFGPFKIVSADQAAGVLTERVDDYYLSDADGNQLPYMDGTHGFGIVDSSTRNAALLGGQLDVIWSVSFEAKDAGQAAISEPRIKAQPAGYRGWYAQMKNVAPFDDYRVRKAIHLAVDRWTNPAIIEHNHPAAQPSGYGFNVIPPDELRQMPGFRQDKTADWAEANRLLDEAGYPRGDDGVRFSIDMFSLTTQFYIDGHSLYMEDLKVNLGINYTLDIAPDSTVQAQRASACDYNYYARATAHDTPVPDHAASAMIPSPGAGHEVCGWKAPQYLKDMATEFLTTVDMTKRLAIVRELEEAYYEDEQIGLYYIPLHNGPYINGHWDYVKGTLDRPWWNRFSFIQLQETWIDSDNM